MRRLSAKIWTLLSHRDSRRPGSRKSLQRGRLTLEALEDRLAPAISGFTNVSLAVVSGAIFIDANDNGVPDSDELAAPGVNVTLSGTSNQGAAVNTSTVTDANGQYTFFQVPAGTYTLTRSAINSFLGGRAIYGDLGGT